MQLTLRTLRSAALAAIFAGRPGRLRRRRQQWHRRQHRRHRQDCTATAASETSIVVTWTAVTGATGYTLERAAASAPGSFTAGRRLPDGGDLHRQRRVRPATAYSYRVAAVNANGTGTFSSTVSVTTAGLKVATLSGNITTDRTLFADTLYTLSGYVKVGNGKTLTIQPGTTIVGDAAVPGSSLWILRGSKIDAQGTADAPIVFTSAQARRASASRATGAASSSSATASSIGPERC